MIFLLGGEILVAIWQDTYSPGTREPHIDSSDSQVRARNFCLSLANSTRPLETLIRSSNPMEEY